MKRHRIYRISLSLFMVLYYQTFVVAQRLPANPDPNKCYVRITAPEEVVYTYEDYLTYTRTSGSETELMEISVRRLSTIKQYLEANLINTDRIIARAWGGSRPIQDCGNPIPCTYHQDRQNERVLIRVLNN